MSSSSQHKQLWTITLIIFFGFLGISIPYLIFPPLFLHPDYTMFSDGWSLSGKAMVLGITLAMYPLGQFLGSPMLGALSDAYGRKPFLSGSLLVAAICNFFTAISIHQQQLGLLMISRFLAGLMEGNIAIARAMCADLKTISKHVSFGKVNAAISMAYLLGPFLGGVLTQIPPIPLMGRFVPTATPFFVISILFVCLAGLSVWILEDHATVSIQQRPSLWQRINMVARISTLVSNTQLRYWLITSSCFTLGVDIFYEFGPAYLTLTWVCSPIELSLYNGVLCFALVIGNGWLPSYLATHTPTFKPLTLAMSTFALALMGVLSNPSQLWMLLYFALCGLSIGVAVTLLTVHISNSVSDATQGETLGVQLSLRVLGDGVICLLGGVLFATSAKLILAMAVLLSLCAIFYYRRRCDRII